MSHLLRHAHRAVAGMQQRVIKHGLLDLRRHLVGCDPFAPGRRLISPSAP